MAYPLTSLLVLLILLFSAESFNLDLKTSKTFHGDPDSYFGYSVALLINANYGNQVLVGAPKADRSALTLYNVTESGTLSKCFVESGNCYSVMVDDRAPRLVDPMEPEYRTKIGESRSNQWLGAAISTNDWGRVAVCAPHYVNFGPRGSKREPTGDCFVSADGGLQFTRVSPCTEQFDTFYRKAYKTPDLDRGFASYHKTGHGMCGFSVAVGPQNELGIGAVGSFYWQGQLYSVSPPNDYKNYVYTENRGELEDNSYMTWAIEYGEFDGDTNTIDYAVSAPRADMLNGRVTIWSKRSSGLTAIKKIYGTQPGGYFGYALAVGDFNGDLLDDIAVSAPFFSNYNSEIVPEIGNVVIYYQREHGLNEARFRNGTVLAGGQKNGRFGLSLAHIGDINQDDFGDLAVGAPYGGPNGRGIIYIYNGRQKGLTETPTQVIYSEDLPEPLVTFGWSIAGKMDVDGNSYSDVAVGAYKSNAAVLFKSRPLVKVKGRIDASVTEIQLDAPCSKSPSQKTERTFEVRYCVRYSALKDPEILQLNVTLSLDSENNYTKRVFARNFGNKAVITNTYRLTKKNSTCDYVIAQINSNVADKTTPITISLDYKIESSNMPSDQPEPILDQLFKGVEPITIRLNKTCVECNPDLDLKVATSTKSYTMGSNDLIDLNVTLTNRHEDSYLTKMNVTLPDYVSFVNTIKTESCIEAFCKQMNDTSHKYINCDVGNPFPQDQITVFTIRVRVMDLAQIDDTELRFNFHVDSGFGEDIDKANNKLDVTIPLKVETSIAVSGTSLPADAVVYTDSHIASTDHRGPSVKHRYEIYTRGPSAIDTAKVNIMWPMYYSEDMKIYILYLYQFPRVLRGDAQCSVSTNYVNPQNVNVTEIAVAPGLSSTKRLKRSQDEPVTCSNSETYCINVTCNIYDLTQDQSIVIELSSFLWMSPVVKNWTNDYTTSTIISSIAEAFVTGVPYKIKPENLATARFSVMSYFEKYRPPQVLKPLDWKWIVIGVGIGLFLLLLVAFILWRCGFFKRHRPGAVVKVEKHEEGEPHETKRLYDESNYS